MLHSRRVVTIGLIVIAFLETTMMQGTNAESTGWTEMYIGYNSTNDNDNNFGDFGPYESDDPLRQHLHILKPPSDEPTPVFFFAHGNGGKASGGMGGLGLYADAGYSVISWESITYLGENNGVVCLSDFELVWSWYQANAIEHNLDPNYAIIGGRSRGSVCSWSMAHDISKQSIIRGIYMHNALPRGVWPDETTTVWMDMVTETSPPAYLEYGPECPKPIQQDCIPSPNPFDGHNPRYGQKIVDRYIELGMQSNITLVDGLQNDGINIFASFPDFSQSLEGSPAVPSSPPSSLSPSASPVDGDDDDDDDDDDDNKNCVDGLMDLCSPKPSLKRCMKCVRANKAELVSLGCNKPIVYGFCTGGGEKQKGKKNKKKKSDKNKKKNDGDIDGNNLRLRARRRM